MIWPDEVRVFFANGGIPNFHVALLVSPIDRSTDAAIDVGYWSGHEDIALVLGGVQRALFRTKGALQMQNPTYAAGTEIRGYRASMFGLSEQAMDLLHAYQIERAPIEFWQLCFDQGAQFIGARRLVKGKVDGSPQTIGAKGKGASVDVLVKSILREGTRTITAKKSDTSYSKRGGDTALEYSALRDTDSDTWGARS